MPKNIEINSKHEEASQALDIAIKSITCQNQRISRADYSVVMTDICLDGLLVLQLLLMPLWEPI